MTPPLMPDVERLVQDALLEYLPSGLVGSKVVVAPPVDWAEIMPLVVVSWRGGAPSRWPERIQITDVSVKGYAVDRAQGSALIREIDKALKSACLNRFTNEDIPGVVTPGLLSHCSVLSPSGIEFEGLTSKHPDSVLFNTLFRVHSSPLTF